MFDRYTYIVYKVVCITYPDHMGHHYPIYPIHICKKNGSSEQTELVYLQNKIRIPNRRIQTQILFLGVH